jgi:hypothetical protein
MKIDSDGSSVEGPIIVQPDPDNPYDKDTNAIMGIPVLNGDELVVSYLNYTAPGSLPSEYGVWIDYIGTTGLTIAKADISDISSWTFERPLENHPCGYMSYDASHQYTIIDGTEILCWLGYEWRRDHTLDPNAFDWEAYPTARGCVYLSQKVNGVWCTPHIVLDSTNTYDPYPEDDDYDARNIYGSNLTASEMRGTYNIVVETENGAYHTRFSFSQLGCLYAAYGSAGSGSR